MINGQTNHVSTPMPSKLGLVPDWTLQNPDRRIAFHSGAGENFTYMFPVIKYAEAYNAMTGPGYGGYVNYLNYNHGNQPYDAIDSGLNTAFRTPALPNWYALAKVSPKSSAPGIQQAQQQIGTTLQYRQPIGTSVGLIGL